MSKSNQCPQRARKTLWHLVLAITVPFGYVGVSAFAKGELTWNELYQEVQASVDAATIPITFSFKNSGASPIAIRNVFTDCGCISSESPKSPIQPGYSGIVRFVIDTTSQTRNQMHELTVVTDDEFPYTLKVLVKEARLGVFEPKDLIWHVNEPITSKILHFKPMDGLSAVIDHIDFDGDSLIVKTIRRSKGECDLDVHPLSTKRPLEGRILVFARPEDGTVVRSQACIARVVAAEGTARSTARGQSVTDSTSSSDGLRVTTKGDAHALSSPGNEPAIGSRAPAHWSGLEIVGGLVVGALLLFCIRRPRAAVLHAGQAILRGSNVTVSARTVCIAAGLILCLGNIGGLLLDQYVFATSDETVQKSRVSSNSVQAAAMVEKRGRIAIDHPVFDFGSVERGTKVKHTFRLTNQGTGLLEIQTVKPSCGCTTTALTTHSIEPKESADLSVELDLSQLEGPQNREIVVLSDDPTAPLLKLALVGQAMSRVQFDHRLVLRPSAVEGEYSDQVTARTKDGLRFAIAEITTSNPSLKANVTVTNPGEEFQLGVSLPATLASKEFRGWVRLRTDHDGDYELITVPVVAEGPDDGKQPAAAGEAAVKPSAGSQGE